MLPLGAKVVPECQRQAQPRDGEDQHHTRAGVPATRLAFRAVALPLGEVGQQLRLDPLDLQQPLPLPREEFATGKAGPPTPPYTTVGCCEGRPVCTLISAARVVRRMSRALVTSSAVPWARTRNLSALRAISYLSTLFFGMPTL